MIHNQFSVVSYCAVTVDNEPTGHRVVCCAVELLKAGIMKIQF